MSPSELGTHPVREVLGQLETLLQADRLSSPEVRASEPHAAAVDGVVGAVRIVKAKLESAVPTLVSANALSQIHSGLQNAFNELNAFVQNGNLAHISNARKQIEASVFANLWGFVAYHEDAAQKAISETFKELSRTSIESLTWLLKERDTLSENIRKLEARVQTSEQLSKDLETRIQEQKAESIAAVAKIQQDSVERETLRLKEFDKEREALRLKFLEMQDGVAQEHAKGLRDLEATKQKAAQILQIVGNIGVTGNYQATAEKEAKQADDWRGMTVMFFFFGVGLAALTLVQFWGKDLTVDNALSIIVRLAYALAITAPAYYTARESARHRSNADRARQTELELASLGPFIELMPEEKKIQIREELTKKYFGSKSDDHKIEPPVDLKEVREFVAEIAKAVRK